MKNTMFALFLLASAHTVFAHAEEGCSKENARKAAIGFLSMKKPSFVAGESLKVSEIYLGTFIYDSELNEEPPLPAWGMNYFRILKDANGNSKFESGKIKINKADCYNVNTGSDDTLVREKKSNDYFGQRNGH